MAKFSRKRNLKRANKRSKKLNRRSMSGGAGFFSKLSEQFKRLSQGARKMTSNTYGGIKRRFSEDNRKYKAAKELNKMEKKQKSKNGNVNKSIKLNSSGISNSNNPNKGNKKPSTSPVNSGKPNSNMSNGQKSKNNSSKPKPLPKPNNARPNNNGGKPKPLPNPNNARPKSPNNAFGNNSGLQKSNNQKKN